MNKYEQMLHEQSDEGSFWPTFTDLITTILLLVLLLLVTMVVVQQEKLAEIKQKQEQIDYLTGVRRDIIQDLNLTFKEKNLDVKVDPETGTIKFSNDLLFTTGKANLRPEFKAYLKSFIPVYFETLYGKYKHDVAEVVVEGHTDNVGTFMYNLDLSQKRAFNVVKYLLSEDIGNYQYKEDVKKQITANGRSYSELKRKSDGTVDKAKSRRVELRFRLKSDPSQK